MSPSSANSIRSLRKKTKRKKQRISFHYPERIQKRPSSFPDIVFFFFFFLIFYSFEKEEIPHVLLGSVYQRLSRYPPLMKSFFALTRRQRRCASSLLSDSHDFSPLTPLKTFLKRAFRLRAQHAPLNHPHPPPYHPDSLAPGLRSDPRAPGGRWGPLSVSKVCET